jgi:hypothetical protein
MIDFTIPEITFNIKRRNLISIPFYTSIAASSKTTLCSNGIHGPIQVQRAKMRFPSGATGKLFYRWFYGTDNRVVANEQPTDPKIWAAETTNDLYTGENNIIWVNHQKDIKEDIIYIKLYVQNDATVQMAVDALVEVLA